MQPAPAKPAPQLDDSTVAYIFDMGPPFEGLRQVAALLSGLLVLVAAGGRTAASRYPVLSMASDQYQVAMDRVRSAKVPAQALHHHHHLSAAGLLLGNALTLSQATQGRAMDVNAILASLERGWAQLRFASRALPGFEIVAFDRACCAEHGGTAG